MIRTKVLTLFKNGSTRILSGGLNNTVTTCSSHSVASSAGSDGGRVPPPPPAKSVTSSNESHADATSTPSLGEKGIDGWQIMAAVCVTRHPVLCPPMTPIEHSYSQHLNKLEVEGSLMSDFELQILEDNARKVLGDEEIDMDEPEHDQESALEKLDMWKTESGEFEKNIQIECEASESGVGTSLSRQVVLVQKYMIGSQNMWLLPQGPWRPGETLRQTSERIVVESCDPSLGVRIMGNAPVGFFKYKYPKEVRAKGYIGAKVFFYRGQVSNRVRRSLPLLQHSGKQDQLWLTQPQLTNKLKTSYAKALSQFLIDDS